MPSSCAECSHQVRFEKFTGNESFSLGRLFRCGFEGMECECRGDGLLECFQGSPVGCVEDSPELDVGDGPLRSPGGSG